LSYTRIYARIYASFNNVKILVGFGCTSRSGEITKNSINDNYTMTHPSLLFLALFYQPSAKSPHPHSTLAAGAFTCAKERRQESPCQKVRAKSHLGWLKPTRFPALLSSLSFHQHSPSFLSDHLEKGFAFNARRRVLKN